MASGLQFATPLLELIKYQPFLTNLYLSRTWPSYLGIQGIVTPQLPTMRSSYTLGSASLRGLQYLLINNNDEGVNVYRMCHV